jgi:molybdopterin molybdotransferase
MPMCAVDHATASRIVGICAFRTWVPATARGAPRLQQRMSRCEAVVVRSVSEHRRSVLLPVKPLPAVDVATDAALGYALAQDVVATVAVPRFDNAAMDGYAIRHVDLTTGPPDLPVVGVVAAAPEAPPQLAAKSAVRIMTGAALPPGADTVVPFERTDRGSTFVHVDGTVARGSHVRGVGEDIAEGDPLLSAGTEVTAAGLAVLASQGLADVLVHRRPRVAVVSTGDELLEPAGALLDGCVYDINGPLLAAMSSAANADVVTRMLLPDDPGPAQEILFALAEEVDLIVSSGGISAGDFEVVRQALSDVETVTFARVAMQPGGPQGSGTIGGCPFVALPGNPVSALASFVLFARPTIRALGGHHVLVRDGRRGVLDEPLRRHPTRVRFSPVQVDAASRVRGLDSGCSHRLSTLLRADALAVVPAGGDDLPAGNPIDLVSIHG